MFGVSLVPYTGPCSDRGSSAANRLTVLFCKFTLGIVECRRAKIELGLGSEDYRHTSNECVLYLRSLADLGRTGVRFMNSPNPTLFGEGRIQSR